MSLLKYNNPSNPSIHTPMGAVVVLNVNASYSLLVMTFSS